MLLPRQHSVLPSEDCSRALALLSQMSARPRLTRVLILAQSSSSLSHDLKWYLPEVFNLLSSDRYSGARPWIDLYVISNILKSILNLSGNQQSLNRVGVMWSNRLTLHISLAAEFCTRCSYKVGWLVVHIEDCCNSQVCLLQKH